MFETRAQPNTHPHNVHPRHQPTDTSRTTATYNGLMRARLIPGPALAGCFIAFTLIGTIQALYGPLLPRYQDGFTLSTTAVGMVLTAHFVGGLIGVLVSHRLRARHEDRTLLIRSMWLMAAGIAAVGIAPNWPIVIMCAFIAGLGFGGIDFGLNQYFADVYAGPRAAAMLNLLNGCFGVGSIAAPLLVSLTGDSTLIPFLISAALSALAAVLSLKLPERHPAPTSAPQPHKPKTQRRITGATTAILGAFFVIYILHVGIETGIGGWEQTYLEAQDFLPQEAHTWVAYYWGGMTLSRFVIIPLALRFSEKAIVLTCLIGMTAFLALATTGISVHWDFLWVGIFIGPIFPTCIPWLNRLVPQVRGATAYVVAISMIGGVGFPPILGWAMATWGTEALPRVLTGMSALCIAAFFLITAISRRRSALA